MNPEPTDHSSEWYKRGREIGLEIGALIGTLAREGQRSTVIVGAARLDVALERLLKSIMIHHPGESDNLFSPDRPLGSFAGKIALCYRLGLIDRDVERSLQLIRRIRNDFAHAIATADLAESSYQNRVLELSREAKKYEQYSNLYEAFSKLITHPELLSFATSLASVIAALELACDSYQLNSFTVPFCARLAPPNT